MTKAVSAPSRRQSMAMPAVSAAVLFVLLGTAVSAATGVWVGPRYLLPTVDAAHQAAFQIDDLGQCTLCLSSASGALNTRRMLAALNAVDPTVATRRRPNALPTYDDWVLMPAQIRSWYMDAEGRAPSDAELGHVLYQWREDHIPASELRRRIFVAAGKAP